MKDQAAQRELFGDININFPSKIKHDARTSTWQVIGKVHDSSRTLKTNFTFFRWEETIKSLWINNIYEAAFNTLLMIRLYFVNLLFLRFWAADSRCWMISILPLFLFVAALLSGVSLIYTEIYLYKSLHPNITAWLGSSALCALLLVGVCKLWIFLGKNFGFFWLMQIYNFSALWMNGKLLQLDENLVSYTEAILKDARENPDEDIVLLAHSVGTMLAVRVAFQLLDHPESPFNDKRKLRFVSLGHCIPLASAQKSATRNYHHALGVLSKSRNIEWLDFSSPKDRASFPLIHPLHLKPQNPASGLWPRMFSPRFHRIFSAQKYQSMRWNWYAIHFLYFISPSSLEKEGYDFYKMLFCPPTEPLNLP